MKAIYKDGEVAEVWEISRTSERPDWVIEGFKKNYLVWVDNKLRILLTGLNPSTKEMLKLGSMGSAGGGGFLGYAMYSIGYEGDIIDFTHRRLISKKRFLKEYTLIS